MSNAATSTTVPEAKAPRKFGAALAMRLIASALVIAGMNWLFDGGARHVTNYFARKYSNFYAVETTIARANKRHPRVVTGFKAMTTRWDELVADGSASELVAILADADVQPFFAGIQREDWSVPRTGCFHEVGTENVYVDVDLVRRLRMAKHKARSLAVAYQVSSALASYVQSKRPQREGPPGEVEGVIQARQGFERDVIAGRIAGEYFAMGGDASKMPEELVLAALSIVKREQGYRIHHLGDWVYPGKIDHATLEDRAKWFRKGVLEPDVRHEDQIYTAVFDDL